MAPCHQRLILSYQSLVVDVILTLNDWITWICYCSRVIKLISLNVSSASLLFLLLSLIWCVKFLFLTCSSNYWSCNYCFVWFHSLFSSSFYLYCSTFFSRQIKSQSLWLRQTRKEAWERNPLISKTHLIFPFYECFSFSFFVSFSRLLFCCLQHYIFYNHCMLSKRVHCLLISLKEKHLLLKQCMSFCNEIQWNSETVTH